tara:strand:- start:503 stop:805 length:303 start_codon:yes stop_codon:yes gene_type:complete
MLFWITYISLNLAISFLAIFFVKNNFFRVFLFFFIFSALSSFWFIEPGSLEVAPILSILILEFSITESNGFFRLLRPLILSIILGLIASLIFYFIKIRKR